MKPSRPFRLSGEIAPLPGPGFSTPTFQQGSQNGLWVQDISADDTVNGFLDLAPHLIDENKPLEIEREQSRGEPAIYVFHGERACYVDTRAALLDPLRDEYKRLEDRPYLRRSIGRFVGDDGLVDRANAQIAELARSVASPARWEELHEGIVRRSVFEDIAYDATRGLPIVVRGRRGSGKTTLLEWLEHELDGRGRQAFRLKYFPGNGLLRDLLRAGSKLPSWHAPDGQSSWSPETVGLRQETPRAYVDAVMRAFEEASLSADRPVTLLVDEFDASVLDPTSSSTADALLHLVRSDRISMVLAVDLFGPVSRDARAAGTFEDSRDYREYLLPDLDAREVDQLLQRQRVAVEAGDGADLQRLTLGRQLSGFNFREAIELLQRAYRSGRLTESALREAVAVRCEQALHSLRTEGEITEVLATLVAAGPQGFSERVKSSSDFEARAMLAARSGLLNLSNDRPAFQHRYVRDWWMNRHPIG